MPSSIACPSCGANVVVRSAALPYISCSYCQTLIRRDGPTLESIGKTAVLPFDVSPIQLGTSGTWRGHPFTIVGRIRWGWDDGAWNEWFAEGPAGPRWLAEFMGDYMITAEREDVVDADTMAKFAAGHAVRRGAILYIGNVPYAATDFKNATCIGGEGDLPFPAVVGRKMVNIDFRSPNGQVLSLQRDEEGASAWVGDAVELNQLSPRNLRQLEGWTIPAFNQ